MIEEQMRFQLSLAEAAQSQLRAQHYAKRIETGVWKERIGRVRIGGFNGELASEEYILKDEVATMNRHIQLAEDHLNMAKSHLHDFSEKENR